MACEKGGKYVSLIILWVLSILLLLGTIIMNIFARGVASNLGIFDKTVDIILDESQIDMVPASWVQWYWVAIAIWQFSWLTYFGINIFRKGVYENEPMIVSPTLISYPVFVFFIIANILNILGLFLWDRDQRVYGLICMSFIMLTMWLAVAASCIDLCRNLAILDDNDFMMDPWIVRFFLHNGLAIYASYCTLAFFLQLNTVIQAEYDAVSSRDGTTIYFGILVFFIVLYFILDITILDRWLRYVLTPYISILIVLGSIIDRNWGAIWLRNYRNPAFIASVLGVVVIFTVTKLLLTIGRRLRNPSKSSTDDSNILVGSNVDI